MQPDSPPPNYLWNVLKSAQSYRNIGYLLLTFPLGLLYFIMLIVGVSLGASLAIIGVGIFILWGVFGMSGLIGNFERWMSNQFLQTDLPMQEEQVFNLRNGNTWRSVAYLALKFPLGLMTFVFTIFVISFVGAMITMPFTYNYETTILVAREIDTLWEALISSAFGLLLTPFALILLGKVALLWRNMTLNFLHVDDVQIAHKKKKHLTREEIEEDVINRLIDEGVVNEASLVESKRKKLSTYGE